MACFLPLPLSFWLGISWHESPVFDQLHSLLEFTGIGKSLESAPSPLITEEKTVVDYIASQPDLKGFTYLHRVSGHNGWTEDYVKMMEGLFDHFITGAADDGLDSLLDAAIE